MRTAFLVAADLGPLRTAFAANANDAKETCARVGLRVGTSAPGGGKRACGEHRNDRASGLGLGKGSVASARRCNVRLSFFLSTSSSSDPTTGYREVALERVRGVSAATIESEAYSCAAGVHPSRRRRDCDERPSWRFKIGSERRTRSASGYELRQGNVACARADNACSLSTSSISDSAICSHGVAHGLVHATTAIRARGAGRSVACA